MAGKYYDDCGGLKPIVIPKQKPKAATKTTKKSTATKKATNTKKK